jgi:hypothetical protein
MGYRGHDDWSDMSEFVVHFTKPIAPSKIVVPKRRDQRRPSFVEIIGEIRAMQQKRDPSGYYPWIDILGEGRLKPGDKALGAGRNLAEVRDLHRVVCFSEIPLDMLDRLIERRSLYGIGFRKDVVVAKGGAPLWYLDKDGVQAKIIQQQIRTAIAGGVDPGDQIWQLTPFIDNPGNYPGRNYRFEWEREWRVVGDFTFTPDDVAFLFLPEDDHDKTRQFFADVQVENSGPSYLFAYIDPRWDLDKIEKALRHVPEAPPPSANATPWWL